ncbi:protein of unknown function [Paraburkholderia dioscoreae]|uniref:Uncharacterized protein n=1 Tax=Paraburkholderia dioscoreae TaxID=2604047 RepID=A0A5Q4ZHQ9_9BURK|nr:protein of unknown function [Paraburkholderia dioscoreae]
MERAALDRAPGGVERERSGQLAGATRHGLRARATGCAGRAQAGEGTGSRKAHRDSQWVAKEDEAGAAIQLYGRDRKVNVSTGGAAFRL